MNWFLYDRDLRHERVNFDEQKLLVTEIFDIFVLAEPKQNDTFPL